MNMIISLDRDLLLIINQMNSPFLDRFFWLFTSIPIWIPLYAIIAYAVLKPNIKIGWTLVVTIALTVILADQISSTVFKHLFERLRPSHEPTLEGVVRVINDYRGGLYGFVSGHAANSFGLATIVALLFRNKWLTISFLSWAAINSYSRVYLGVHYPGDILGGAAVGIGLAFGVFYLYNLVSKKYKLQERWGNNISLDQIYTEKYAYIIVFVIVTIATTLLLASKVMMKFI